MHRRLLAILALSCAATSALHAADQATLQDIDAAYKVNDYERVEKDARTLLAANPKDPIGEYHLACALSHFHKIDEALSELKKAQEFGFSDAEHAANDGDLVPLHERKEFNDIVQAMRSGPYEASEPIEPDFPIDGMTSIEGAPDGGLRYRLRIGKDVTPAHPVHLVVWLHPSGASGDRMVEPMSVDLAKHGYGLVVFTQKQYMGWSADELNHIPPSLNEIGKKPGVDLHQPILMGFSAGGQAALMIWAAKPSIWGGLMLSAAYPFDMATRQVTTPTADELAAKVPMMALVGDQDGGVQVWRAVLPSWTQAGLPVTVREVKGRKHEFLFQGAEWTACLAWLDQIRKGQAKTAAGSAPPMVP